MEIYPIKPESNIHMQCECHVNNAVLLLYNLTAIR